MHHHFCKSKRKSKRKVLALAIPRPQLTVTSRPSPVQGGRLKANQYQCRKQGDERRVNRREKNSRMAAVVRRHD